MDVEKFVRELASKTDASVLAKRLGMAAVTPPPKPPTDDKQK